MINTHLFELPLSRTYFCGSKGVRAIEVLLYYVHRLHVSQQIDASSNVSNIFAFCTVFIIIFSDVLRLKNYNNTICQLSCSALYLACSRDEPGQGFHVVLFDVKQNL